MTTSSQPPYFSTDFPTGSPISQGILQCQAHHRGRTHWSGSLGQISTSEWPVHSYVGDMKSDEKDDFGWYFVTIMYVPHIFCFPSGLGITLVSVPKAQSWRSRYLWKTTKSFASEFMRCKNWGFRLKLRLFHLHLKMLERTKNKQVYTLERGSNKSL